MDGHIQNRQLLTFEFCMSQYHKSFCNKSSFFISGKTSSDKSQTVDTIAWNPHGNQSTPGDPSSRATAIAALLEKHEKKGSGNTSRNVSSCTITKPITMEHREDFEKAQAVSIKTMNHQMSVPYNLLKTLSELFYCRKKTKSKER